MTDILHSRLPEDMHQPRPLPGIRPVEGLWLRRDEAYAGQMALRETLLATRPEDVLWQDDDPATEAAAQELLAHVTTLLPELGYDVSGDTVLCPDGRRVARRGPALRILARLLQCDLCLLDKAGAEHVLKGAALCFPASWTLAEKAGRPLVAIHSPVEEYDATLAARVQRLFDGVQPGRPIWRFNQLWYADPALHQPRRAGAERDKTAPDARSFLRCERQTILRLPQTRWAVFAIHTYVLHKDDAPAAFT
ncbi:DUF3445 domain-containing protein [Aliishimia ponticola]|uniref:DUF3445 domain-containing protein n=1 Tax=Aliishimia ponticola TaxID=2499833 RepID=A0A4S4NFB9_9RHOB|nr:DUF3445 domain-containing protein [Aliishimia ponticola]THH38276.1 DUF3445 domain-containing protein [Aliishimia ponticola]